MKTGYVYDPIYLKHDTGNHVENALRLEAIVSHLEQSGLTEKLTAINPRPATVEELSLVHQEQHIRYVEEVTERGGGWLDGDTVTSSGSYQAALYASGGVIAAMEAVINGEVDNTFALVRPPGHHATARRAMGFCLFNNVAVAAKNALDKFGLKRIVVIDFDVHHGNGTQEIFYNNPNVLYLSTHLSPFYPGTGSIDENGSGEARGSTVNVPLPAGCGDIEYAQVFEQIIVPVTVRFQPQFILVSAGYDPHWADELALMQVSVTGFARMVTTITELADKLCGGRLVVSLEGGYNLTALAASVKATFDVLLGETAIEDPLGQPPYQTTARDITSLVNSVKEIHDL
ncbi:histone deacetylase, partial [Chloroflexota bacterium]